MNAAAKPSPADHSRVVIFPPVIPVTSFVIGVALERLFPLGAMIIGVPRLVARGLGAVILVAGVAGFAWMIVTMKRARTPIHNARTPTTLVENGPFRFSRNPMYVFGSTWYAGLALVLAQPYSLVLLALASVIMHYGVVLREEDYLERRFGDAYRRYKARVPRYW